MLLQPKSKSKVDAEPRNRQRDLAESVLEWEALTLIFRDGNAERIRMRISFLHQICLIETAPKMVVLWIDRSFGKPLLYCFWTALFTQTIRFAQAFQGACGRRGKRGRV